MRNSKFGLRAFGLALMAALGLMAFSAVAAQAEEKLVDGGKAAKFLINKNAALATLGVTFEANQVGAGTLLVPGRVDILCQKGTATGEFHNETDALVTATFTECLTWQPVPLGETHKTHVECTVKEPITAKALVIPKKHEGKFYLLLEAEGEAKLFTTIFLEGAPCPLTKENKVTGSLHVEIDNNETTEPLLLFGHGIQLLFQPTTTTGNHLKFGTFDAFIDADATAKLTDEAHKNKGFPIGVC